MKKSASTSTPLATKDFPLTTFENAIALTPISSSIPDNAVYEVNIKPDWSIGSGSSLISFRPHSPVLIAALLSLSLLLQLLSHHLSLNGLQIDFQTVPHGGYLLSILTHATSTYLHINHPSRARSQPHLTSYHAEFLSRARIGEALVDVLILKLGKQFSTFRVGLLQRREAHEQSEFQSREHLGPARLCVEALVTMSNLSGGEEEKGISMSTPPLILPSEITPRAECTPYSLPEIWKSIYPASVKAETLLAPAASSLSSPSLSPQLSLQETEFDIPTRYQWVRWLPTSTSALSSKANTGTSAPRFTLEALSYMGDDVRHVVATKGLEGCVFMSLNMGMNVLRAPKEEGWEWFFMRIKVSEVKNGRCNVEVLFVDEEKRVFAVARQVLLIAKMGEGGVKAKI